MYCDKEFNPMKDSARYCSNSCRTSANKQRRKYELKEKERQMALIAQKEKDDQQKLIDDEERRLKAEKRREAKEAKTLVIANENTPDTLTVTNDHQDTEIVELTIHAEEENKLTVKPEITEAFPPKDWPSLAPRKSGTLTNRPKFNFWEFIATMATASLNNIK